MSLVRKRSTSSLGKVNQPINQTNFNSTKKKPLSKPGWDGTSSDLDQYKLNKEEIERRKSAHLSKNAEIIKLEKQRQSLESAKKGGGKKEAKAQLALLKEILYDDEQLKNLILKSDVTLKAVQEFFDHDEPINSSNSTNKKQARITMTLAPNASEFNDSNLPHYENNNKQSTNNHVITTAKVNNLNMPHSDKKAQNEHQRQKSTFAADENSNSDDESEILNRQIKHAKLNEDLENYRELLELKQKLIEKKLSGALSAKKDTCKQMNNSINDAEKINRLKNMINNYANALSLEKEKEDESVEQQTVSQNQFKHQSLNGLNEEFRKALNELEMKMVDYEKELNKLNNNGNRKSSHSRFFTTNNNGSMSNSSSYTLTLIKIVSTLIDHLKELSSEVNYEKLKHAEANKQLDIHRKLIDGLTTEILCVKEQNEKIISEYAGQQAKIESELDQIKIMLRSSALLQTTSQLLPPPNIDSRPKVGAFQPQPQTNLDLLNASNLFKPYPQQQQQQNQQSLNKIHSTHHQQQPQQQPQPTRPMSAFNLSEILNTKGDKFIERINSMLQTEGVDNQLLASLILNNNKPRSQQNFADRPYSSISENLYPQQNCVSSRPQTAQNSASSTRSLSNFNAYSNDFNSQISELCSKNSQAQQKLKQIQSEQFNPNKESVNNNDEHKSALGKLKLEQQMLKDQIDMLNKQRESASYELEVLGMNSMASSNNSAKVSDKSAKSLEYHFLDGTKTPSLSPIQPALNNLNHFNQEVIRH